MAEPLSQLLAFAAAAILVLADIGGTILAGAQSPGKSYRETIHTAPAVPSRRMFWRNNNCPQYVA